MKIQQFFFLLYVFVENICKSNYNLTLKKKSSKPHTHAWKKRFHQSELWITLYIINRKKNGREKERVKGGNSWGILIKVIVNIDVEIEGIHYGHKWGSFCIGI